MTNEKLKKAEEIQYQINTLTFFQRRMNACWKRLKIKTKKLKLFTSCADLYDEIEASERLTDRIEKAIEDELNELKKEFEEL